MERCFSVTSAITAVVHAACAQPSITGVGDLFGGPTVSVATAVSADGNVVVGYSSSFIGVEAFRWTEQGGMAGIGPSPVNLPQSEAFAVSAGGDVVVGFYWGTSSSSSFRWTQATGMLGLAGFFAGTAWGVSADGSVVVGQDFHGGPTEAYRWTESTGFVFLGDLPGGNAVSVARGVSADGAVVVGHGHTAAGDRPFRWTAAGGMTALPTPAEAFLGYAWGVSGTGTITVGDVTTACGPRACFWTGTAEPTSLHDRAGTFSSGSVYAASADGAVLVGRAFDSNYRAFVWTAERGMVDLRRLLIEQGVATASQWSLLEAHGVSADGTVIVGMGNRAGHGEGFVARITLPLASPTCYADCNADGALTIADFACFQNRYVAGEAYANCNSDCGRSVADFACFQTAFVAGCP